MMYVPQIMSAVSPANVAVTLDQARQHCRIDFEDDDDILQLYLDAAIGYVQNRTGRRLASQQLRIFLDFFEQTGPDYVRETSLAGYWGGRPYTPIILPFGAPLVSVESLSYTDYTGVKITWTGLGGNLLQGSPGVVKAQVDTASEPGRIVAPYGTWLWPTTTLQSANAIQIDYTAGYASADLPAELKQVVLLNCNHWYKNREAVVLGKSVAIDSKLLAMGTEALMAHYITPMVY